MTGEHLLSPCYNYYSSHVDRTVSLQAKTCSRMHVPMRDWVNTYCRSGILTLVSESESTASGASTDDKTATVQYKPVTSLTGNSNARAHYEQSCGYDQTSHALPNIHGLYGCSYISIYSLNTGKFPGRFSYKWPGYEASVNYDNATVRNTAVVQFCGKKVCKIPGKMLACYWTDL